MLPQIQNASTRPVQSENIAAKLILEDHMRSMLAKNANQTYKPWKNKWAPSNPHSAFGDFPPEKLSKTAKPKKRLPDYETSQAATKQSMACGSKLC